MLKEGGNTSQSLRYNYDYLNRMVKVSEPGKALTLAEYTYDSNNNLTKESLNNGQYEVQYTYNAANLITGMVNKQLSGSQTLSSYSYTYSLDGNRLSENNKTYSYDAAGRLKAASQNGVQYSYNYDRRGNRSGMQVTANGQSMNTAYTYNQNNQLLQESKSIGVDPVSTTWYTYDARGNLLSSTVDEYSNAEAGAAAGITGAVLGESETSGAEVYEYDVFGKMEQIQKGNQIIRYGYNADGQRIEKTVNSQSTEYIWDGDNIVSEKTGDGPGIYYQRGLGLIASAQGDEYYRDYYFKNAHGDVTGVYYAGNNSQKAGYEYDPFGKQINGANGEEWEGPASDSNPYRYAGEYYDRETGSIYLRARYYDPSYGRFTSEDPIKDGLNWYVYCANNPVLLIDPFGLAPSVSEAAAMAEHIYGDYDMGPGGKASREVEGWRLIDVWYGRESMKMGIYIREGDNWQNPSEYVIVFRGTSTWFDDNGISSEAWNNLEAASSGRSADMWDAMNYGKGFVNSNLGKEVTFVGHSKGGGEAIAAADYMDCNAITFNAANFNFSKYVSGKGKGSINNYYVEGEILESTIGTASIGTTHWLPKQYAPGFNWYDSAYTRAKKTLKAAIANHGMAAVRQALN